MANSFFERIRKPTMAVGVGVKAVPTQIDEDIAVIKRITVKLTSTQIRTLNATPVDVIAAPGTGKAISIIGMHAWLDYNSAAYDSVGASDDLVLKYSNSSGTTLTVAVAGQGFADATTDKHVYVTGVTSAISLLENTKVVAHLLTGEWYSAAGNSPIYLDITYLELPFTFNAV